MALPAVSDIYRARRGVREYELYHMATPRSATPEYHAHDFYEFYFFIAGDTTVYIEEYTHKLHPGDVVIFPPGYMHRVLHQTPDAFYERMLIYASQEELKTMGSRDYSLLKVLEDCIGRSQFRFSLDTESFEHCRLAIYDMIHSAIDNKRPAQSLINRCRVQLLLATLCAWFEEMKGMAEMSPPDRIGLVIAYINEHVDKPLSLEKLSGLFFISKYHLLREFKRRTNKSIYQFILSKRVNLAKLVLQSGLPPSQAAARCGFSDYSSFFKAFKKETGVSPNHYIAALKNADGQRPSRGI